MEYFSTLKEQLSKYMGKQEIECIHKAYLLAKKAHQKQSRQTGEPYIIHPVSVAITLAKLELDTETITAALLHDVIEDTLVGKAEILEQFGSSVTQLVEGVSKLSKIQFANKTETQAENFRKMILATAKDLRVILVKLADRLHNMQTLSGVSRQKSSRVARETLDIYVPLANRLGMYKLRVQLEDLCFIALYPIRELTLRNAVKKMRVNRQEILQAIEKGIGNSFKEHKLMYIEVQGREKHLYGIYRKMRNRRLSLEQIMDVFAFRIIVDKVEDCYLILGCVHNLYKPVSELFKDYIAVPKANGYQSLHTILFGPYGVPIEIQIRTWEMHKMAEYGIAAHWLYKATALGDSGDSQQFAKIWVKNLLEMQKSSANSEDFIEKIKLDLFPDKVYVFTPKGDIYELPRGATPVDLAYAVNTELGNRCVAAKIDRQYALLNMPLLNGQMVQIMATATGKPNLAWLNFVATAKARSAIDYYFKHQRSVEVVSLGKNLLEQELARLGTNIEKLSPVSVNKVLTQLKLNSIDELYEKLSLNNYNVKLIAQRFMQTEQKTNADELSPIIKQTKPMIIHGTESIAVTLASCCYPVLGDSIVGHIDADKGMIVHLRDCKSIAELNQHPEQLVLLHWNEDIKEKFAVKLIIDINNQSGVIAKVLVIVASMQSNIEDIHIQKTTQLSQVLVLLISVINIDELKKIMRLISRIKAVNKIARMRS